MENPINSPSSFRGEQGKDTNLNDFKPNFEKSFTKEDIKKEAECSSKSFKPVNHDQILKRLIDQIRRIDFRELAGISDEEKKLNHKHFLVICIEQILNAAQINNWGICKNHGFIYLYNGAYWSLFDNEEFQVFLGVAAEKMGIDPFTAKHYLFREQLYKQFLAIAILPKPEPSDKMVLINLINGTFEISPEKQELRPPNPKDFITHQLPFEYNPKARAPVFEKYLNIVLPDIDKQKILAEYLGYLFIKPKYLKLEKVLLLYGTGANGKSVFFDVINSLLGGEANISNYSLQQLTDENGYFRAKIGYKLLNYASEINGKIGTSIFKQLASGEPVGARLPYCEPFNLLDYAKLIFNCNELPKDVEQTLAFFRRFLIIGFDITIPKEQQDKELAKKIIENELTGVFNWVLEGLKRLLIQKDFTASEAVNKQIEDFKIQSDTVQVFLIDEGYEKCTNDHKEFKDLYSLYRCYCQASGYHSCSKKTFGERLRKAGYVVERRNIGMVVFVKNNSF